MNENQNIILKKQENRYKILLELWRAAEGREYTMVNFFDVASNVGFDKEQATEIYYYLSGEGFFELDAAGGAVTLSHRAIVEIEKSIKYPQHSTEHFPSTVIQNFNAPVGSVQTGNHNAANVNQNIGQNFSEILEQLTTLKNQFQMSSAIDKEEAVEIVDDLQKEIVKEMPNKNKIKLFLVSTKDFALKTGTELAASTVAKLIESQMGIGS